jgi:hypothetical protein
VAALGGGRAQALGRIGAWRARQDGEFHWMGALEFESALTWISADMMVL